MINSETHLHSTWPVYLKLELAVPAARRTLQHAQHHPVEQQPTLTQPAPTMTPGYVTFNLSTERLLSHLHRNETWTLRQEYPVLERVLSRQAARTDGEAHAPGPWETLAPPAQIVVRPQASSPQAQSSQPASEPFRSLRYWDNGQPTTDARRLNAPEVNIPVLTDQVIHVLDHRVISARERMGKK